MATSIPPSSKNEEYLCAIHGNGFLEFDYETSIEAWPTLSDAKRSAAKGCLVCSMVCKSVACYDHPLLLHPDSDLAFLWQLRGDINDLGRLGIHYNKVMATLPVALFLDVYVHKCKSNT
jgi:hypothetical protein